MNYNLTAGNQKITIPNKTSNGEKMAPGYYMVTIEADGFTATKKILMIE